MGKSNEKINHLLNVVKTIAVVGLSNQLVITSYQVSKVMQHDGYKIIPVNPMIYEVLGEKAFPSLLDIKKQINVINVFRQSEHLVDIANGALQTNSSVLGTKQGVINEEAYYLLKVSDFTVIMDLCIKVAHAVLSRNK